MTGRLLASAVDSGRAARRGDQPDLASDSARAAYLASYLAGRDVLMIARAHETCRELAWRVRDYLFHLGLVDDLRTVELRNGTRVGPGDIIVARRNDHRLEAGEGKENAGKRGRDARSRIWGISPRHSHTWP